MEHTKLKKKQHLFVLSVVKINKKEVGNVSMTFPIIKPTVSVTIIFVITILNYDILKIKKKKTKTKKVEHLLW